MNAKQGALKFLNQTLNPIVTVKQSIGTDHGKTVKYFAKEWKRRQEELGDIPDKPVQLKEVVSKRGITAEQIVKANFNENIIQTMLIALAIYMLVSIPLFGFSYGELIVKVVGVAFLIMPISVLAWRRDVLVTHKVYPYKTFIIRALINPFALAPKRLPEGWNVE